MITVLLAAYNGERFLPEQLSSLQSQQGVEFCVLLQDDGSADRTPGLIRQICAEDPRFRPGACAGQHLGASQNFFSLIRQAGEGDVALCDQDDVWLPDRLSACAEALRQAEAELGAGTPILVHSDAAVTDASGQILHEGFIRHQGWDPQARSLPQLLVQNNVTGCTVLFNDALRRLIAAIPDLSRLSMHDWFLAQAAAACGSVVFVPRALVRYRQHGANAIGASGQSLTRRAFRALRDLPAGRARIRLTYAEAEALLAALGDALPAQSRRVIENYLALQRLPRLRRLKALRDGGYLMQSPVTRLGQLFFS
ncbi:MAG: glycosyltransferase family 2 protein [Clostridia bacterium]|nr:glycosyltransferase family 2 protein [Clostridia bacterium]